MNTPAPTVDPLIAHLEAAQGWKTFVLQDQTAAGLDQGKVWNWGWCQDYQLKFHYGYSPWVERGITPPAHCIYLPPKATVPVGSWPIYLQDTSPDPGTLGFHQDKFASKVGPSGIHSARGHNAETQTPEALVFVKTCEADGVDPLEVVSHEALETIVDPWVMNNAEVKVVEHENKLWIVEVGDPVEGNGYALVPGYTLADFVFPRWYGMPQQRQDMSFRNSITAPFTIAPAGYQSVAPVGEPENWTQIWGVKAFGRNLQ